MGERTTGSRQHVVEFPDRVSSEQVREALALLGFTRMDRVSRVTISPGGIEAEEWAETLLGDPLPTTVTVRSEVGPR